MKELSMNVLDIAKNSVKAKATLIEIRIDENDESLTLTIRDNGCGMKEEMVRSVIDPFCTTRTTRKVGLGIPLLKLAAEQTGGNISIVSKHESKHPSDHGTVVVAVFHKKHIDFTPMGDIVSTVTTLIQGSPEIDFVFLHSLAESRVELDTRQMREMLGEDIPLSAPEIIRWIASYLTEQYDNI